MATRLLKRQKPYNPAPTMLRDFLAELDELDSHYFTSTTASQVFLKELCEVLISQNPKELARGVLYCVESDSFSAIGAIFHSRYKEKFEPYWRGYREFASLFGVEIRLLVELDDINNNTPRMSQSPVEERQLRHKIVLKWAQKALKRPIG